MHNIVQLNIPFRQHSKAARQAALLSTFAHARRSKDDVFWLKENAEMLNILQSTGQKLGREALSTFDAFYDQIETRVEFFPQYYRFLLSICLDLEDLGMPGSKGAALTAWAAEQRLAEAELSDLQRAEARRLCARRGVEALPQDHALEARLRQFAGRAETFALPNKKAAYELTHIVFYLSEYGTHDPQICAAIHQSLLFAGTLAFLDYNADLLAEICIALCFARKAPPPPWELWLTQQLNCFRLSSRNNAGLQDDYHEYLMLNWFLDQSGHDGFAAQVPLGRVTFSRVRPQIGPLRELSETMYAMGAHRSDDWEVMREAVSNRVSDQTQAALMAAEASTAEFGAFFAGFARVGLHSSPTPQEALA
ncbi:hypothetical protein KUD11_11395 [Roseovarius sp. LXJ103]|uniref:DUF6902 family protein n=1 Tax=Roseovarius carneus TaxID=2853164 RepID=UPI000D60FE02|nr:hypothetical protein [Roseovarius carneus]MBZ8119248.1 hypothetical protein [Roseovarius carneus]PWE35128.1 hypothetical protein DD563_03585 [Pelagicola sp. LXJ1103]